MTLSLSKGQGRLNASLNRLRGGGRPALHVPQTFVPNIFLAKPQDYQKATQRVYHALGAASFIELPVVAGP